MSVVLFVSDPFTYPGGGVAAGVPVRVYFSETAVPCAIYHDSAGAVLKGNPVKTDNAGVVSFYIEPGEYDLVANGIVTTVTVQGPVDPPDDNDFITVGQADDRYVAITDGAVESTLTIRNPGALARSYRFRTTGSELDLEAGGTALNVSTWTNPDFSGTQRTIFRSGTAGDTTFPNEVAFNSPPTSINPPTLNTHLANKAYTDLFIKGPSNVVEQFFTWSAGARWATFDAAYNAADNNPDFLRCRVTGGARVTTPWRVNGNYESRHEPSANDRHGWRAFEYAVDGSTGLFASFSTNPADSSQREYLFGMRGTAAGVTRPGYGVFTRGIEAPQIRLNGVDQAPGAWTSPDLSGSSWAADVSGTYDALQFRIEGEWIVGAGRVSLASPTNYVANARILTLPAGMFPAKAKVLFVRSGGTGAAAGFADVSTAGVFSFGTAITNASGSAWFQFDQFRIRRV